MNNDACLHLHGGQAAMFGYGSLLSRASMELTLGRPYSMSPVACTLLGWRRSWDVIMPNRSFYAHEGNDVFVPEHIVYLNVRPSAGDEVNGLLYVLEPADVQAFDEREWIYNRLPITQSVRQVGITGGEAYVYVAKPEWRLEADRPRQWAALRRSYLDVVEAGLVDLGSEFRADYERSTDPVPLHRVFADQKRSGSHSLLADRELDGPEAGSRGR